MYTLINRLQSRSYLLHEAPALLLSWILAELFYKFGSFTLEMGAFLCTWYALGFLSYRLRKR